MKWMMIRMVATFLLVAVGSAVIAMPDIRVLALFKNKAMLEIDGKRRMMTQDKPSPEGVTLVSSNGLQAVVEFAGEIHTLKPKMRIGGGYGKPPQGQEFRIVRDISGHFRSAGTINGRLVTFLVDTGATSVAMSERHARQLGIDYEQQGTPIKTLTASGEAKGYQITLKKVSLGKIRRSNVKGVVIEGNSPREILLGMSFLKGLEMNHKGNLMVLKQMH